MLYSEFLEGTKCRDNETNYKIYKQLELIYMSDDSMTKADVYEYGKKLVDNSKSIIDVIHEKSVKKDIKREKEIIKAYKEDIKRLKECIEIESDPAMKKSWQADIKWRRQEIKKRNARIQDLKFYLS
jgi:protein subunit release factor A